MTQILRPDLCILGGGAAGLAAACTAANLGAKVVLVEKRTLGGAYLARAIPIQALCAAALARGRASNAAAVDLPSLRARMKESAAHFTRDYSPARLAAMNIQIIRAAGSFSGPARLEAGGFSIEATHFIVATGATHAASPIAGLDLVRPLLPEELLFLEDVPKNLVVIGGGSHELVLAQAFLRLGSHVSLVAPDPILPDEDQELVAAVLARLGAEGLAIHQNAEIAGIEPERGGGRIDLGEGVAIEASQFIVGTSSLPCVEGFGLKAARVGYSMEGIETNGAGRTSNPRIHAAGAVRGGARSGAPARHQGEQAAAALFGTMRAEPQVARVLGTDPEMATIGLTEAAARARHKAIRVLRTAFSENERALSAFGPDGHVKIVTDLHGYMLGAGIVGPQARELIGVFSLAIANHMKAADLDAIVSSAPTLIQACRTAALASAPQLGKAWGRPPRLR